MDIHVEREGEGSRKMGSVERFSPKEVKRGGGRERGRAKGKGAGQRGKTKERWDAGRRIERKVERGREVQQAAIPFLDKHYW